MPSHIAALAYMLIGIGSAWFMASVSFPKYGQLLVRVAASLSAISVLMIFSPSGAVFFLASAMVLLVAAPRDTVERILYFCAMLPSIPLVPSWSIPFPGINYLFVINYPRLLMLVVLLPLIFSERDSRVLAIDEKGLKRVVFIVCCYLALGAILDFRSTSLTNGMREFVVYAITYGIPVLALARVCAVRGAPEAALFGMMIGGIFVFFIGLMQFLSDWYFYLEIDSSLIRGPMSYEMIFDYRGGRRIPSTMEIIPFGVYMSLCAGIAYACRERMGGSKIAALLAPMFAVGTLFSGSRAAQISVVLIAFLLFYFSSHAVRVRKLLLFGALVVLVGGVTAFNRISALDPYGTFQYRVDLLSNSAEVIAENPVFGTPDYRDHPSMERSRQGQGIIDVVNAYLSVILRHGTAGLALFVIPLWLAMRRLSSYRWRLGETGDPNEEYFVRLLLALMISYAFALATVSMVDRLSIYYWILIVVGAGVGARTAVPESVAEKPTSGPARRGVSVHDYAR